MFVYNAVMSTVAIISKGLILIFEFLVRNGLMLLFASLEYFLSISSTRAEIVSASDPTLLIMGLLLGCRFCVFLAIDMGWKFWDWVC